MPDTYTISGLHESEVRDLQNLVDDYATEGPRNGLTPEDLEWLESLRAKLDVL